MNTTTMTIDLGQIARELGLKPAQVETTLGLLDLGNTVPFITRYRKDQTGGLDEVQIRGIADHAAKLRMLLERKQTILRSIELQGKLTPDLAAAIEAAQTSRRLDDLYLPFKPKKQTLATLAHERGLEPLAGEILRGEKSGAELDARAAEFIHLDRQVPTAADALLGAGHILAEQFSERADVRQQLRKFIKRSGKLTSKKADADEKLSKPYSDYFDYQDDLHKVPPHRVMAINRGERAKVLRVKIEADAATMERIADELLVRPDHPNADFLRGCVRDALARLILPSLERELRRELTEKAEEHAIEVFARNLRNLLLQPPVSGHRVLAVDPGFRSGCKLAAIDEFGRLLDHGIVHLVGKDKEAGQAAAKARMAELIRQHQLTVVAIGNGTACRETEQLVAELIAEQFPVPGENGHAVAYVIVNEAGASVYSTSALGREEFPEFDATLRGAISIGRRLLDPLSELVKIEPANIGVGLYQHDVKTKHLRDSLDAVVESCVNYVGVDPNTASPALLRYVSGLNQLTARRLFEHRCQNGPFRSRQQLLEVSGFGDATFVQAAGFLRIAGGDNPLDATWIHPESYDAAQSVLSKLGSTLSELVPTQPNATIAARTAEASAEGLSSELGLGAHLVLDILTQLARPGRDPREGLPAPIFRHGILKMEDLSPGMELAGTVLNVVDFGAFVDIGLHDSGLVHVSQMANRFVRDPHEVVAVGDVVKVWVTTIDKERRRVGLSMVPPGTERPQPQRAKRTDGRPPRRGRHSGRHGGQQDGQHGGQAMPNGQPAADVVGAAADNAAAGNTVAAGGATIGAAPSAAPSDAGTTPTRQQPQRPSGGGRSGQQRSGQQRYSQQRQGQQRYGQGRGGQHDAGQQRSSPPPVRTKPKPIVPITKAMEEGREPLRTFGDLAQFFEKRQQKPSDGDPPAG